MSLDVAVIGAANLDLVVRPDGEVLAGTSNPSEMGLRHGGAGRNVACCLAGLSRTVSLTVSLGEDADGAAIADDLSARGVAIDRLPAAGGRTGRYVAIIDADGELLEAFNDMTIHEATTSLPDASEAAMAPARWWFADANLASDLLEDIALREVRPALAVHTVSTPKAVRLAGLLDRVDILFANQREAEALLRHPEEALSLERAGALATELLGKGPSIVAVTASAEGAAVAVEGKLYTAAAIKTDVVDIVGAGDAFAAGFMSSILAGDGPEGWLRSAIAAAAITVGSAETAPANLDTETIAGMVAEIAVTTTGSGEGDKE
jgi:pseudouridine kinase